MLATDATATSQHAVSADLGAACEANRTTDQAVITNLAVVSYLHQVIDFYPGADKCHQWPRSRSVPAPWKRCRQFAVRQAEQ